MKHTDKFAVLRNKKSGTFLNKYKSNKGTFAYSVEYTNDLKRAAKNELKAIEDQKEDFEKLANALDCEILIVEAEYTLKTLDGNEPEELTEDIEDAKRKYIEGLLKGLLSNNEED
ncbi:hypothetical protein [Streptococcus infantis]|uniref:hypothetical protein n=1 Tax=Streptococcus infantis TaxID=68892 RepID=UPI0039C2E8DD